METGETVNNKGKMRFTTLPDITGRVLEFRGKGASEKVISGFLKKRGWTTERLTAAINKQTAKDEAVPEEQAQEEGGFWDSVNGGLEYFNKATDSMLLGGTFGLTVPARAAGRWAKSKLVDDESISFSDAVDSVQEEDKEWSKENPNVAMGTEIAGGIAGGMGASKALTTAVPALAPVAGAGKMNLVKGVTSGAGIGTVEGGGVGAAKGGGAEGTMLGMMIGGGSGAAGVLLLPAAQWAAKKLASPIRKFFGKTPKKDLSKAEIDGEQMLEEVDQKDSLTVIQKEMKLAEYEKLGLGDEVMEVDLLGKKGQNLAGTIMRHGDKVPDAAETALVKRAGMVRQHIYNFLQDATGGKRVSLKETGKKFRESASEKSREFYDAAYYKDGIKENGMLTIKDPRIDELFKLPDFKKAYQRAIDIAANAKPPYKLPPFPMKVKYRMGMGGKPMLDAAGNKIPIENPSEWSVFALDKVKKALHTKYDGYVFSSNDMVKAKGGDIISYKNDMLNYIEDSVPAYKQARNAYAGDMELKDAKELGEKLFDSGDSMDKLYEYGTKLRTESEKREFSNAAFNMLAKKIESSSVNPKGMAQFFMNEQNMHKLSLIIPDAEKRGIFLRQNELLSGFVDIKNKILGGSQSVEKLAADAAEEEMNQGLRAVSNIVNRNPAGLALQAQEFGGTARKAARLDEAGKKMYQQTPPKIQADHEASLITNKLLKKQMRGQNLLQGGASGGGASLMNSLLQ